MSKYLDQVAEFHKTFRAPILDKPQLIPEERSALRISLILEELKELQKAIQNNDLVEVADALCDLQYVLSGTVLEFGMKELFDKMFDEVHRSNMSKACSTLDEMDKTMLHYQMNRTESYPVVQDNGKYIVFRVGDDKILKSINYSPANLSSILKPACDVCGSHFSQDLLDEFSGMCELCYEDTAMRANGD